MKKRVIFLMTLSVLVLLACSLPFVGDSPEPVVVVDAPPEAVDENPVAPPTAAPSPTPDLSPVTVQVNADGSGDYASLHAAVAAVTPGSTINLGAGVFTLPETLEINKPLHIIGIDPQQTIIRGTVTNWSIVIFTGPGTFSFQNIAVEYTDAGRGFALNIIDGEEIHIKNCRFSGAVKETNEEAGDWGGSGILVQGASSGVIEQSEFFDNQVSGIQINGESRMAVIDNHCHDNEQTGISMFDDSESTLLYNETDHNGWHGIYARHNASFSGSENAIFSNTYYGVYLNEDASGELTTSAIAENESNGVLLKSNTFLRLKESDIFANGLNGIELNEASRAEIVDNIIQDNQGAGLIYRDTSGGVAQENQLFGNKWGIYIEAGATPEFSGNVTTGNTEVDFVDKR